MKRSCLKNLIKFFEQVIKVVDVGGAIDIVYMDFGTFDKVWHNRLL